MASAARKRQPTPGGPEEVADMNDRIATHEYAAEVRATARHVYEDALERFRGAHPEGWRELLEPALLGSEELRTALGEAMEWHPWTINVREAQQVLEASQCAGTVREAVNVQGALTEGYFPWHQLACAALGADVLAELRTQLPSWSAGTLQGGESPVLVRARAFVHPLELAVP